MAPKLAQITEASAEPGAEAAWEEEIERRIRAIDAGLVKGRPFANVIEEIDRQLAK